jgi:hypothetical protein
MLLYVNIVIFQSIIESWKFCARQLPYSFWWKKLRNIKKPELLASEEVLMNFSHGASWNLVIAWCSTQQSWHKHFMQKKKKHNEVCKKVLRHFTADMNQKLYAWEALKQIVRCLKKELVLIIKELALFIDVSLAWRPGDWDMRIFKGYLMKYG